MLPYAGASSGSAVSPWAGSRATPAEVGTDDRELLIRVGRDRDRSAFAELFRSYEPRVRAYLLAGGLDDDRADDVVQDVMIAVWRASPGYDPDRGAPAAWIFTMARNRRTDLLRQAAHAVPEVLVAAPDPDAALDAAQAATALRAAVSSLPPEQAAVVRATYLDDRTLADFAEREAVPLGTVKSRLRLALARLRRVVAEGSS